MSTSRSQYSKLAVPAVAIVASTLLLGGLVILLLTMSNRGGASAAQPAMGSSPEAHTRAIRFAVVPERDIFEQRSRFVALTEYLGSQVNRPIELQTLNSYQSVIDALADGTADAACLGSMAAVVAFDRIGVRVLAKPVQSDGLDHYSGLILVRSDSDITTLKQLAGRRMAMVRLTTAGHLFPIQQLLAADLLQGPRAVAVVWAGTHDDSLQLLLDGQVEAAAMKNLRLLAYEQERGKADVRILAESESVPNNAIFVRPGLEPQLIEKLHNALMHMHESESGRAALRVMSVKQFADCDPSQYAADYELIEAIGDNWPLMGIDGPPPKRPSSAPKQD
ncbi:MAG: phosphate/phosphite/phosphonate ABC transporter substrate-binding protein [Phycisphaeraceae bacterium]|nr:phosphate/phosphite/phosphonate ABC transporter substrate-binding protein [Phycisphaeraceae bacterium]